MLENDVIDRIRHIFLQPRPHVSISQATALLGWTRHQMSAAIEAGEVELSHRGVVVRAARIRRGDGVAWLRFSSPEAIRRVAGGPSEASDHRFHVAR